MQHLIRQGIAKSTPRVAPKTPSLLERAGEFGFRNIIQPIGQQAARMGALGTIPQFRQAFGVKEEETVGSKVARGEIQDVAGMADITGGIGALGKVAKVGGKLAGGLAKVKPLKGIKFTIEDIFERKTPQFDNMYNKYKESVDKGNALLEYINNHQDESNLIRRQTIDLLENKNVKYLYRKGADKEHGIVSFTYEPGILEQQFEGMALLKRPVTKIKLSDALDRIIASDDSVFVSRSLDEAEVLLKGTKEVSYFDGQKVAGGLAENLSGIFRGTKGLSADPRFDFWR